MCAIPATHYPVVCSLISATTATDCPVVCLFMCVIPAMRLPSGVLSFQHYVWHAALISILVSLCSGPLVQNITLPGWQWACSLLSGLAQTDLDCTSSYTYIALFLAKYIHTWMHACMYIYSIHNMHAVIQTHIYLPWIGSKQT